MAGHLGKMTCPYSPQFSQAGPASLLDVRGVFTGPCAAAPGWAVCSLSVLLYRPVPTELLLPAAWQRGTVTVSVDHPPPLDT